MAEHSDAPLLTRRALSMAMGVATLVFGAAISFGATEFSVGWGERGPEPGYFPFWIGVVIMLASVGTLVQAFNGERAIPALTRGQARRALVFTLPMLGFVALAHLLGLYVAMTVYLFGVMVFQGRYSIALSALVSLGTAATLFVMFDKWLQVPLAKGPLEALLKIY